MLVLDTSCVALQVLSPPPNTRPFSSHCCGPHAVSRRGHFTALRMLTPRFWPLFQSCSRTHTHSHKPTPLGPPRPVGDRSQEVNVSPSAP